MTRDQALQIADDLEAAGASMYDLLRRPTRTPASGEHTTAPDWQLAVIVHNRPNGESIVRAALDAYRHRAGRADEPVPISLDCGRMVIG